MQDFLRHISVSWSWQVQRHSIIHGSKAPMQPTATVTHLKGWKSQQQHVNQAKTSNPGHSFSLSHRISLATLNYCTALIFFPFASSRYDPRCIPKCQSEICTHAEIDWSESTINQEERRSLYPCLLKRSSTSIRFCDTCRAPCVCNQPLSNIRTAAFAYLVSGTSPSSIVPDTSRLGNPQWRSIVSSWAASLKRRTTLNTCAPPHKHPAI